jgi:hypothetical protein
VTFWGANWTRQNRVSHGRARDFFGFAGRPSTSPPACGGSWTTAGRYGEDIRPPRNVPSYLGVVVASSIRTFGGITTGNVVEIVVVRTNPGYTPNPAPPGTGTVVAVFCAARPGGHGMN